MSIFDNYGFRTDKERKKSGNVFSAYSEANKPKNAGGLTSQIGYTGASLIAGVAGIFEGIADIAASATAGDKEYAKYVYDDNRVGKLMQGIRDDINPGPGTSFAGDVATGIGQSSVFLLDALVPFLGTGLFFTGITGAGIGDAVQQTGELGFKEVGYGVASGALEAVTEKVIGAGGKVVGNLASAATQGAAKTALTKAAAKSGAKNILINVAKAAGGEFAEEFTEEFADVGLKKLFKIDPDAKVTGQTWKDALYSGVVGAISGGLMATPAIVVNYKGNAARGQAIAANGRTDEVIGLARKTQEMAEASGNLFTAKKNVQKEARAADTERTAGDKLYTAFMDAKNGKENRATVQFGKAIKDDLDVWDSLTEEQRSGEAGQALLGQIEGNLTFHWINGAIEDKFDELISQGDDTLEKIRSIIASVSGREYTLQDVKEDKDGVLRQFAAAQLIEEMNAELEQLTKPNETPDTQGSVFNDQTGTQTVENAQGSPVSGFEEARANTSETQEKGKEGGLAVNPQGKRVSTDTGRQVRVKNVKTENGRLVFETEGNELYKSESLTADKVQWESQVMADAVRAAEEMKMQPLEVEYMIRAIERGTQMNGADYALAYHGEFIRGKLGEGQGESTMLSQDAKDTAYLLGDDYGKRAARERSRAIAAKVNPVQAQKARQAVAAMPQAERVKLPDGMKFTDIRGEGRKAVVKAADILSKATGMKFEFYQSFQQTNGGERMIVAADGKVVKAPNGWYDTGTGVVHVDLNAGTGADGAAIFTMAHETGHWLMQSDPESFRELGEFMFEKMGEDADALIRDKQAFMEANGRLDGMNDEKKYAMAYEEVVCDLLSPALKDGRVIEQLAYENKSLFTRVWEHIKNIISNIRDALKGAVGTNQLQKDAAEKLEASMNEVEDMFAADLQGAADNSVGIYVDNATGENVRYSIREEEPPKKTLKGYKVFVVKDGKLYPPMVANPGGNDTPVGVWLNADIGQRAPDSKTGRMQVKAGGKGTQGGSGSLAFRPGWHLGETPLAKQFDRTNPETGVKEMFPENFVWAECEIAADKDYQDEAMSYGYTKSGKFQHSLAGLPRLPVDGYYRYRTNPNPDTVPWLITGAMKVSRLLGDEEVNRILRENGLPERHRLGGDKTLADLGLGDYEGVRYSDRDSEGNTLTTEQKEFFKDSKVRDENGRLRVVYHGTNEDFTVFNQDFIGMASGDSGYFGKGFYFAYTEGEAEYYGSRNIIKAYLNIERPFDFRKEFHTYYGERAEIGKGPDMVALINLSEKFPDIGKKVKIAAQKNGHNIEITANDLGTLFRRFMQDKTFIYGEESDAEGNTYVTVKADPKEFKETINGNEFSWTEYEYEGEFATKPNTLDTVSDYIARKVFDRIRVPNFTQVILDNNTEFTDELKKRGYDGTVQSEEGDEACAFYSEQIKRIDNKSPTSREDIRFSDRDSERNTLREKSAAYQVERDPESFGLAEVDGNEYGEGGFITPNGKVFRFNDVQTHSEVENRMAEAGISSRYEPGDDISVEDGSETLTGAGWNQFKEQEKYILVNRMTKDNRSAIREYVENWFYNKGKRRLQVIYDDGTFENFSYSQTVVDDIMQTIEEKTGIRYSDRKSLTTRELLADVTEEEVSLKKHKEFIGRYRELVQDLKDVVIRLNTLDKKKRSKAGLTVDEQAQVRALNEMRLTLDDKLTKMEGLQQAREIIEAVRTNTQKAVSDAQERVERAQREVDEYKEQVRERFERYREKRNAREQKNMDAMRERLEKERTRNEERRDTYEAGEIKRKTLNIINKLNRELMHPTRDKNIPAVLQPDVVNALEAISTDVTQAEARMTALDEKIAAEMAKDAPDMEQIRIWEKARANIEEIGKTYDKQMSAIQLVYEKIKNSQNSEMRNAYDPGLEAAVNDIANRIRGRSLNQLTLDELKDVRKVVGMVEHLISTYNDTMATERKQRVSDLGEKTTAEIKKVGGEHKTILSALHEILKFGWSQLKPAYAVKVIGSDTLQELYNNLVKGEDVWAVDKNEAKQFADSVKDKYGFGKWDLDKVVTVDTQSGKVDLNLKQIMSLYAYSKRPQAVDHLTTGGFVLDSAVTVTKKWKGIPISYDVNIQTPYRITLDDFIAIQRNLTDDQRAFVDDMMSYLSTTLAAKGNEVSRKLYGIDLFNEETYFPIRSARQFIVEENRAKGDPQIKNKGMTKQVTPGAGNPIVLSDFTSVWANHVEEMALYHGLVLPMEDFNRVFNWSSPTGEGVKVALDNAYGPEAKNYITELMQQLNGGLRRDRSVGLSNRMLSGFKRGATMASLSVVIQQPTSIIRSMTIIDPKYFKSGFMKSIRERQAVWDELKSWAPVALIKESGSFDVDLGASDEALYFGKEYGTLKEKAAALAKDADYRNDVLGKAPEIADQMAWCYMWEACKNKIEAETNLKRGSDEFMRKAADVFSEAVRMTQVYDSRLTRSQMMRSPDFGAKLITTFMAEPTTSFNMLAYAVLGRVRGDKDALKAIGYVVASILLNSILVSAVYAMRDDDEDKTYGEKYVKSLIPNIIDNANPLNMLPITRDVVSLFQGYDVERADMSLVSDVIKAFKGLSSSTKSPYRKIEDFAGSVANIFGIPAKNVLRDVRGMINTAASVGTVEKTGLGTKYAILSGLGKDVSKGQQMYDALIKGDVKHYERVAAQYKTESAARTQLRLAMRASDERISLAAEARAAGNVETSLQIQNRIIEEGHFDQDDVIAAINAEYNLIKKEEKQNEAR